MENLRVSPWSKKRSFSMSYEEQQMDSTGQALLAALAPYNVSLGPQRPDGGRVLMLMDDAGELLIQRVLNTQQLTQPELLADVLDGVRRDLLVAGGGTAPEGLASLRYSDRVKPYAA